MPIKDKIKYIRNLVEESFPFFSESHRHRELPNVYLVIPNMPEGVLIYSTDCSCYYREANKLSQLDILEMEGRVWISRIIVSLESRNKGIATVLLATACTIADIHHIPLYLGVNSYGEMSNDSLKKFYREFGFQEEAEPEGLFKRVPQNI